MATNYLSREQAAQALQSGGQVSFTPQGIVQTSVPKSLPITGSAISGRGGGSSNFATPNNYAQPNILQKVVKTIASPVNLFINPIVKTAQKLMAPKQQAPPTSFSQVQPEKSLAQQQREQAASILQAGGNVSFTPEGIIQTSLTKQQAADITKSGGQVSSSAQGIVQSGLTKQQAASILQAGGQVSFTPQGIKIESLTEEQSAKVQQIMQQQQQEQNKLVQQQINEVIGKPSEYTKAEKLVNQAIEKEKRSWSVSFPLSSGAITKVPVSGTVPISQAEMERDYTLIYPTNTRYNFAQPTWVKKGAAQKELQMGGKGDKYFWRNVGDIWAGSAGSLFRPFWREAGLKSGARTPEQTALGAEKIKSIFTKVTPVAPWLAPSLMGIEGFKEARAQRIGGEQLEAQQKFITEQNKQLTSIFENKYPSTEKIIDWDKWEQYKGDLLDLKRQQAALGFYQPDEKTLLNPILDKPNVPMYYKQVQQVKQKYGEGDLRVRGYQTAKLLGDIGEAAIIGGLTAGTGLPEVIGAKTSYLIGNTGSKVLGGLMIGGGVAFKGYGGLKNYQKLGMSPWEGAIEGGLSGAGEVAGFMVGASKGQLSPVKAPAFKTPAAEGQTTGETLVRTYGLENPLNPKGKFYPIATWTKGKGLGLGYGKKLDAWELPSDLNIVGEGITSKGIRGFFQAHPSKLFTEQIAYEKGLEVANLIYDSKAQKAVTKLELTKSRVYSEEMNAKGQKAYAEITKREMEAASGGEGALNAGQRGLEKIYGSSVSVNIAGEKAAKANVLRKGMFEDFDKHYWDTAIDKAQAHAKILNEAGQLARNPAGTGAVEIKGKSGKWVKLEDLHGTDLPELALQGFPLGYQPHPTKRVALGEMPESKVTHWKGLPASQLQDETIAKLSSISTPYSKEGQLIFSTTARRYPKDYYDIPMQVQGLTGNLAQKPMAPEEIKLLKNLGVELDTSKVGELKHILSVTSRIDWSEPVNKGLLFTGTSPSSNPLINAFVSKALADLPSLKTPSINENTWEVFLPKDMSVSKALHPATFDVFMPASRISPSSASGAGSALWESPSATTKIFKSSVVSKSISPSVYSPSPSIYSPSVSGVSISSFSPSAISLSPSPSKPSVYSPSVSPSVSASVSQSTSMSQSWTNIPAAPFIPPIPMLSGASWSEQKPKQRGRKKKGYTPDFTAAVLGLKMGKQSKAQVDKLLDETYTGLEIRKGW